MVRYVLFIVFLIAVFTVAVVFAAINPAPVKLDLAFTTIEIQTSLALLAFLGVGWLFGLLSSALLLLKFLNERRQLRKALRLAEAEVKSLRSMPVHDAH